MEVRWGSDYWVDCPICGHTEDLSDIPLDAESHVFYEKIECEECKGVYEVAIDVEVEVDVEVGETNIVEDSPDKSLGINKRLKELEPKMLNDKVTERERSEWRRLIAELEALEETEAVE
jgi:hypothetical protein